jgi:DNA-binding GntR family transcriptional regulator
MVDKNNSVFQITKSLSEPIYDYLKKSIISNEIKANERINEKEIAENFGVSRTPVREAIIRLSVEGFINIHYHKDSVVNDIPYEELEDILQVISCSDAYAITQVVDRISAKHLIQIEGMIYKLGKFLTFENSKKFFDINFALHELIWSYLPKGFLRSILECGAAQIQRYSNKPHLSEAQIEKIQESSLDAHRKILPALKAKDKKILAELFGKHWIYPGIKFLSATK